MPSAGTYGAWGGALAGLGQGLQALLAMQERDQDRERERTREAKADKRQAGLDSRAQLAERVALAQSGLREGAATTPEQYAGLQALSAIPSLRNTAAAIRPGRQVQVDAGHYLDLDETPAGRAENLAVNNRTHAGLAAIEGARREGDEWTRRHGVESAQRMREIAATGRNAREVASLRPPTTPRTEIPTDGERKGRFFFERAQAANQRLGAFDNASVLATLASRAGMLGNWANTPSGRQLMQAGKTWALAVLRQDSGGVITDDEMEEYFDTYLPRPGDDDATLAMKRQARNELTAGLRGLGGRAMQGAEEPASPAAPPPAAPGGHVYGTHGAAAAAAPRPRDPLMSKYGLDP